MAQESENLITITAETRQRIRALRVAAYMSADGLAGKALVSKRTIEKLEAGAQGRFRQSTVLRIAKALDLPLAQLLGDEQQPARKPRTLIAKPDFTPLADMVGGIDKYVLRLVRDHRTDDVALLTSEHRDLLRMRLIEAGLPIEEYVRLLRDAKTVQRLIATAPKPDLRIEVEPPFKSLTFTADDGRIRIDHPTLLWDCHCQTPGTRFGKSACPIHREAAAEVVARAFFSGNVEISWRGLRFAWKRLPELWPPSVDAFWMIWDLQENGLFRADCQTVLDLGSGTGFLGVVTALMNPHVQQLHLADWLLTPGLFGAVNWAANAQYRSAVRIVPQIGMLTSWINEPDVAVPQYDVVLCNPPYLPILEGFEDVGQHGTVAGTDLLIHAVTRARSLGRRVFVQFSHLAHEDVAHAAEVAGVELKPIGAERETPFRVASVWEEGSYVKALIGQRGLILKKGNRHPYWHRIRTYQVI